MYAEDRPQNARKWRQWHEEELMGNAEGILEDEHGHTIMR